MRQISLLLIMVLLVPFLGSAMVVRPSGFLAPVKASGVENGLVGCWNFDEGSGTVAHDSSGNGNDGTLYNEPAWVDGRSGKALYFNGVDQYAEVAGNTDLNPHTSNWTISAWVNIASLSIGSMSAGFYGFVIAGKRQDRFQEGLTLLAQWGSSATSAAKFAFIFDQPHAIIGAATPWTNVFGWHYVAGVRNGTNLTVYVDGDAYGPNNYVEGSPSPVDSDISSDTSWHFAHHGGWGEYGNGTVDEVRMYARALTRQEILADMSTGSVSDEFNVNTLNTAWTLVDLRGDCSYSLTANPGYLRIFVPGAGHDLYPWSNYNAPRVVQVVNGDFNIETRVLFDPQHNAQGAGILVWQDINNYLRLDRLDASDGQVVDLSGVMDGSWTGLNHTQYGATTTYLRLQRVGDNFTAAYSSDGINWDLVDQISFHFIDPLSLGLFVLDEWPPTPAVSADFDYFRLTSGPSSVEASITPSSLTTSIGGTASFNLEISNNENTFDTFNVSLLGLDSSWCSLSQNNLTLSVGEVSQVELDVRLPWDPGTVGTYSFTVTVAGAWTQTATNASLAVTLDPILSSLQPDNGTTIGSTNVLISWETSSNASSEVYIKQTSDLDFNHAVGIAGESHYVYVSNLTRNADYLWYAYSGTPYGNVSSDIRALHVSNGVSFIQRNYTFNVNRDYAQNESISVVNTDVESHDVFLQASSPYDDLIVGFVGSGSVDENITLQPGETEPVEFEVFAQDAMQSSYMFTVNLTSFGAKEIVDYASVNINVRQPNINLTLSEDSTDPVTLTKAITATNFGDPITDLSIGTSNDLAGKVSFQPSVIHANVLTGGSLTFEAMPVLTPDFTGCSGLIIATSAGKVIASLPVNFTLPPGKSVYSVIIPQMSIVFDSYYDTDDSPNTNPLPGQLVESYIVNGTIIFASQIIVDVYQNGTPANGANVSLTVWDETETSLSTTYAETDFTGKALFNVFGLTGNYSYQANLVGYSFSTEIRNFSVDTNPLFEIHPTDIAWLDVYDGNSTFDLSQNASCVLLDQAPFVFRAEKNNIDPNATFTLCLSWDFDRFKNILIPGYIVNDTMVFNTSCIPTGNFSAVILYYSNSSGLSLSPPINVTNTDLSALYLQGNYTYRQPFPLNSTHYVRLSITRSVNSRDPAVAFDLYSIQPAGNNILYNLTYLIVTNETTQRDFQISVEGSHDVLYNNTFNVALEPWKPTLVSFTIPAYSENGTLLPEFNATISSEFLFVTIQVQSSICYIYDPRIWVGSDWGFLRAFLPPPSEAAAEARLQASMTCGAGIALDVIPVPGGTAGAIGKSIGVTGVNYATHTKELSRDLLQVKLVAQGIGAVVGAIGGAFVAIPTTPAGMAIGAAGGAWAGYTAVGALWDTGACLVNYWDTVQAEATQGSTGAYVCKESKTGMWYCTNRPVVSAQVSIDPPSADILQAAAVVKFSLPLPIDTYRPHNVHLFVNGVEIGNLTDTIPNGYYIFPFNTSLLNYAVNGPSENTITMKMDNLNGGHYVVTSDWEIMLQMKQLTLSVVASNQTEAESLVEQLTGAVASMADFNMSPTMGFSTSQPTEGQSITIEANVLNSGTAGMSNVPVDLYVDSVKVESVIISFLPGLSNQTVDFSWTATRGLHDITIIVNGAEEIPESDYRNNQAQTSITVLADDVAIANVLPVGSYIQQGSAIPIIVTTANKGDFTETFNVTVYANSTIIGSQTITLASKASTTIMLTWITTISNLGNYTISAYATPVAGEIETADNTFVYGTVEIVPATTGGSGGLMPYKT